jgi:hypothetical protein
VGDFTGKLVYRCEKTMPAIVQQILEEMGFVEWDGNVHGEDEWNILWKNTRYLILKSIL